MLVWGGGGGNFGTLVCFRVMVYYIVASYSHRGCVSAVGKYWVYECV